jgi:hypothetical protein
MTGDFELPLGRFVMNFGALEWALIQGISMMTERDPARYDKVKLPTTFTPRLDLFDKMVRLEVKDAGCLEAHARLIARIGTFARTRNDLIHGPWFDIPGTNIDQVKGKLAKRQLLLGELLAPTTARGVSPAEVATAANKAHEMLKDLSSHLAKVGACCRGKPSAKDG